MQKEVFHFEDDRESFENMPVKNKNKEDKQIKHGKKI